MYHFIINPSSRTGKGQKIWDELEPLLIRRQIPYKAYYTQHHKRGAELAEEITTNHSPCHLIVLGGDGTVNEVINGIHDMEKVFFSYIPTGSSNDFARGLSLPTNPQEALEAILSSQQTTPIDIACIRYGEQTRLFAGSSGIGLDAAIGHDAIDSKLKKFLNIFGLGKLTYVAIALKQLALFTPRKMTLLLDETEEYSFQKTYFIAMMNLPYEGGGLKITPQAVPDDELLNICVVEGYHKLALLCLLPTAFFGKHINLKGVHLYTCKKVKLTTETELPVHTDGESCSFQTSIEISYIPQKLGVVS